RGYVCASIDYRLGNFLDLISLEGAVKTVFRAVQDGKAAVRFFRKSVEEEGNPYGINPATIYTGGTSAGGILSIHLAYVDDVQKLPLEWQTWLNEVGGLEGNSGNPGYCSKSNGVFSFSGAIADTVWLESNDVPIYSVHSTEDDIVPYGFGRPLGGNAPIDLYGSGLITPRMQNLQVPVELDRYEDSFHPSFQTDNQMETQRRVDSTERRLVDFLYSLLPCNTNNVLQAGVEQCETFGSSINELGAVEAFIIYPNPAETELIIERRVPGIRSYRILDFTGKEVQKGVLIETKMKIQLDQLQSGTYLLQIDGLGAKKLLLQ
ncbi:MAG: T9SS type A sorting domain-containing protein, partial [Luteibaculum sp.]